MIYKIRGEIQKPTNIAANYALKIAKLMDVVMPTIRWNNFTIQIDIKPNYVILLRIVNMVSIAHLLMAKMNSDYHTF